jgi:hypothetical protein
MRIEMAKGRFNVSRDQPLLTSPGFDAEPAGEERDGLNRARPSMPAMCRSGLFLKLRDLLEETDFRSEAAAGNVVRQVLEKPRAAGAIKAAAGDPAPQHESRETHAEVQRNPQGAEHAEHLETGRALRGEDRERRPQQGSQART